MSDEPESSETVSEPSWTIGRLLNWTTEFLTEKGIDSPRLEAEVLLAHARSCQRIELYAAFEEAAEEPLRERFRSLVKERAAGKPVAYLVGQREFYSLSFQVTPDVLIPRPETEQLVLRSLDIAKGIEADPLRIADIGTGSGVLAVCLAKYLPEARVTAADVSPAALEVARKNAERHEVNTRIRFVESDLFGQVPAEVKYEIIVSNPPYVKTSELAELAIDVRGYEPALALDGGEQGVDVISRLVAQAAERLNPGGWLLMEIGPSTVEDTEQLVRDTPGLELKPTLTDDADLPRIVQAQRQS
ncbi:peptide chain release factor N(5)-glutamine methyltransferase [Adhaeretor mobilis]|uniref:Release factor glutamine methyltransferase n=1 Tax=Adhaeretor mobilis TaxID=1930276 RepID=A0A517MYS7_9BACT|nr:peptide chain release factor N(5)-glutamine methyltransferase [Adhaeretor mobilis]QDT00020.1 Release factor glutamine methyltransferase [Adhaeretor mobilis]